MFTNDVTKVGGEGFTLFGTVNEGLRNRQINVTEGGGGPKNLQIFLTSLLYDP